MLNYPLFIGTWEIIIIAFVILLIWGGKKLPELMKGLGQGVKSFKQGLNEVDEQINQAIDAPAKKEEKKEEKKAE